MFGIGKNELTHNFSIPSVYRKYPIQNQPQFPECLLIIIQYKPKFSKMLFRTVFSGMSPQFLWDTLVVAAAS